MKMNDGDWVCSDQQCGNVNFARRTSCNRCGKEKSAIPPRKKLGHEIGKAAAEKSRGLFSADDWQCGRCGNVNWARRQQCNMCNAPKFGEVEERTGLGGGYNERENVEYIDRGESDGEYDDFGRKKKKYRGSEDPSKAKAGILKQPSDEEKEKDEEEEDEEDDDDGDLSKYDLTGWGDDDDDEHSRQEESKGEKRARSRSRSSASSASSDSSRSRSSSASSRSSRSSRSRSSSSSASEKQGRSRQARSRCRSSSPERNHHRRARSRSPLHGSRSRSNSPASYRR